MPGEKHVRVFLAVLYGGLALGGLWLGTRFVLPWAAPFLAGGALAALVEPVVRVLTQRVRLPRWGAAALCPRRPQRPRPRADSSVATA